MKLSSCKNGPLLAMMLSAACGGRDTTDLINAGGGPAATEQPRAIEQSPAGVPLSATGQHSARAAVSSVPSAVADAGPTDPVDAGVDGDAGSDGDAAPGDAGAVAPDAGSDDAGDGNDGGTVLPLGACLSCAQSLCSTQYANAVGGDSSAANVSLVTQLFDCVIGGDWELGNAIPQSSCFFADPAQPLGSLLPCYCGSTPLGQCLATGPIDGAEACGDEVELASQCDPVVASCVTSSGSNPELALGDALQFFNCERAACPVECGFPPIEE